MSEEIGRFNVLFELITKEQGKGVEEVQQKASGLQTIFKGAAVAFAGIVSAQAVKQIVGRLFEVTAKYQKYNTVLQVALKSEREAAKAMELIEKTASSTIFSVDELTSSYIKFVNRGINPTQDQIMALADLAASQGKSFDQLTEAVLDATTGEFERLKEFGIKASKEGDKVKLAFKGITKEVNFTGEAINGAVLEFGKMEGVAGSNVKQMGNLAGLMSNIGDSSEKLSRNLGERLQGAFTGVLNVAKAFVEKLVEWTSVPLQKKIEDEQLALNVLVQTINDTNTSSETRVKLMDDLNSKYPYFIEYINKQKKSTDDATISANDLNVAMDEFNRLFVIRLTLESQQEKITEILTKQSKVQGEAWKSEQERRIQLNETIKQFKLPVDLQDYNNLGNQTVAVIKALQAINEVDEKGRALNQGAFRRLQELQLIRSQYYTLKGEEKELASSLKREQDMLKAFEESAGFTLDAIRKIFEPAKKEEPAGGDGGSGKDDKAAKAALAKAKQKLENELKLMELFAQKNIDALNDNAKQTISNKGKLDLELQKLELEHQLVMLSIQRDHLVKMQELTGESQKIQLEQLDYQSQKLNQIYDGLIKMESIDLLDKAKDGTADLKDEIEAIVTALQKLRKEGKVSGKTGLLVETINEVLFGDKSGIDSSKPADELQKKIDAFVEKGVEGIRKAYEKPEQDKGSPLEQLLGLSPKELEALDASLTAIETLKDAIIDVYDSEIEKLDELIDKQADRVSKAEQMAEKGKVAQLKIEEERLSKLQEKQEKYAQQQRIIAQLNITTANAQAAANSILAITKAFAEGGPAGIITGIATSVALAAQIGAIIYSMNNAFNSIPSYYEGIERTGKGNIDSKNGFQAVLHPNERVVPEGVNKKIGYDFPNAKLADAVDLYRQFPRLKHEISGNHVTDEKRFKSLEGKIDELKTSIESININTKLDRNGFVQAIERDFDRVTRRKKIMG